MKQYSDAQLEKAMLKPMCQSVENGSRTSSCERKRLVNHVMCCNRQRWDVQMRKPDRLNNVGEETEMERMWELAVCEEVSEEQAYGKRIWNSTWLDSRRPGLVRSRLGENRVGGACKRENVFAGTPPLAAMHVVLYHTTSRGHGWCLDVWSVSVAFFHAMIEEEMSVRPPKNMRKDKSIWRLPRAMHGILVASSCWRRLVRERLCDSQWKILTSMPCVGYNETEGPLAMFHEDDFMTEGHDSALGKLDAMLDSDEVRRSTRIGPTACHEGMLLYRTIRWNESGFSNRPRSQARGCTDCEFLIGKRETCFNAVRT